MKRIQKIITNSLLLCLLIPFSVNAQLAVSGKVVDATSNEPLIGVGIVLKQAAGKGIIAATSDITGSFKLTIPENSGTLQVSYVGYKNQSIEVTTSNATDILIKLVEDIGKLDEVIVTGLATNVKRSNLANNVATVSAKELTGVTAPQTVDGALSGKIPGANIISNSGAPGGGISVKMRGVTTINASSQPLYIVDGVFMDNSSVAAGLNNITAAAAAGNPTNQDNPSNRIADLNPFDIENIEVLKGAAAAAIYGSQAAAGVVVVTTKRGFSGSTKISFSQDLGMISVRKLLGVRQFDTTKVRETFGSSRVPMFLSAQAAGKIYDYEKEMYGNVGLLSNTRLSLSGGNERTTFYVAGSIKSEEGIVKHTGYDHRSVRANIEHKLNDRASITYTGNYVNSSADRGLTNNDNNGVTYGISLSSTPSFVDLHPDANGIYPRNPFGASNVLQTRDLVKNNERVNRYLNGLNFKVYLHQSERTYTRFILNGGLDYYNLETFAYFPRALQFQSGGNGTDGASLQGTTNNLNMNTSAFLVNSLTVNEKLNLTTSAGVTYEEFNQNSILNYATKIVESQSNLNQAGSATVTQLRKIQRNNGFFAQEEINFNEKVIATAGIRVDQTTNNGDYKKLYAYPKLSVAWNVYKTSSPSSSTIVDNLKLRIAYGQAGNNPPFASKYTSLGLANIGGNTGSLIQNIRGNKDIRAERQSEIEGGFDISFFNGLASLEATYYNKNIDDLILLRNLPGSTGFLQQYINAGSLRNQGVELSLRLLPVRNEKFRWESRINFWKNQSRVTKLDVPAFTTGGFGNSLGVFQIEEGKSATQIIGLTGDGKVGVLGDAEPDFQMNTYNEFTFFKNITFTFFLHWKQGAENINLTQLLYDLGGTTGDYDDDKNNNGVKDARDRTAVLGNTARPFVVDASYLKIRELGLYYSFPAEKLTKTLKGLRLGVSANNYFVFTKYNSYDPEVSNFGINGISSGVEVTPYPASKRLMFHLTADF